ncbi:hypothetical protein ACH5RR_032022 [Cinchona calisaya]|uniref:non-specific serine/threonine protein kinase n=1 Tax=Cinchona calisaya TaxID=153742 RepID=A0ABD2YKB6_9GENT
MSSLLFLNLTATKATTHRSRFLDKAAIMTEEDRFGNIISAWNLCIVTQHPNLQWNIYRKILVPLAGKWSGNPKGEQLPVMDWATRVEIAIGSTKGLAYIFMRIPVATGNPTIIHRDIKAANILLDSNYEPKMGNVFLLSICLGPQPLYFLLLVDRAVLALPSYIVIVFDIHQLLRDCCSLSWFCLVESSLVFGNTEFCYVKFDRTARVYGTEREEVGSYVDLTLWDWVMPLIGVDWSQTDVAKAEVRMVLHRFLAWGKVVQIQRIPHGSRIFDTTIPEFWLVQYATWHEASTAVELFHTKSHKLYRSKSQPPIIVKFVDSETVHTYGSFEMPKVLHNMMENKSRVKAAMEEATKNMKVAAKKLMECTDKNDWVKRTGSPGTTFMYNVKTHDVQVQVDLPPSIIPFAYFSQKFSVRRMHQALLKCEYNIGSTFNNTNNAASNPFAPKPFGSTAPFGSQTGSSFFGSTSTGVFGSQN